MRQSAGSRRRLLYFVRIAMLNFGLDEHYQRVRGGFVEGEPAYPGAAIRTRSTVQIAVRGPACVLGYFRVPE